MLVEENRFGTISTYECAGVEVVRLQLASDRASKVRAVLHPNGSGSVKLSAEFRLPSFDDFTTQEHTVVKLMKDLGYRCQDGYLGHQCTKFWFTNELGSLTVYPLIRLQFWQCMTMSRRAAEGHGNTMGTGWHFSCLQHLQQVGEGGWIWRPMATSKAGQFSGVVGLSCCQILQT